MFDSDRESGARVRSVPSGVGSTSGRDAVGARSNRAQTQLAAAGVALLLLATSAGGAAVLVWWAVHFHPDDRQMWMVPVGLVLFGTPVVTWFSVFASNFSSWLYGRRAVTAPLRSDVVAGGAQRGVTVPDCERLPRRTPSSQHLQLAATT